MSRGGRGGGSMVGGGRMRGHALPFEVDPELIDEADQQPDDDSEDDVFKELFPPIEIFKPRPLTEKERAAVQRKKAFDEARRNGRFWTGTKEDWAEIDAKREDGGGHDPFNDAPSFSKKNAKRPFKLADLSTLGLHKEMFPKELHSMIDGTDKDDDGRAPKRQKKKLSAVEMLARFDERDEDGNPEATDDEEGDKADDDDGLGRGPRDDDFDEDDADADNDYNAEGYFDAGEEDYEEAGGDEYGGDDGLSSRKTRDDDLVDEPVCKGNQLAWNRKDYEHHESIEGMEYQNFWRAVAE